MVFPWFSHGFPMVPMGAAKSEHFSVPEADHRHAGDGTGLPVKHGE